MKKPQLEGVQEIPETEPELKKLLRQCLGLIGKVKVGILLPLF